MKEQEPLKSKIKTLKKVFSFDEKNYNNENPGPTDEEIDCVKELCEYCEIDYYKTLKINNAQKPIFFNQTGKPTQTESWKSMLRAIQFKLVYSGFCSSGRMVPDDKVIGRIIKELPSFEQLFREQNNIKKPDTVDYVDYKACHCSIIELIEADDFIDFLTDKKRKGELESLLKNEYVKLHNYRNCDINQPRCPIEIESSLLSLLQGNTLKKFDTAQKLLNFYYETLYSNCSLYFYPYFSFAYRVVDLFHKKEPQMEKSDFEKFENLRQLAAKYATQLFLRNRYYSCMDRRYIFNDEDTILGIKKIFSYVDMFETQHTSEFNLTDEVLKEVLEYVKDIFYFMRSQALIDDSVIYWDTIDNVSQIPSLQQLNLSAISANGWDCFCEFCVMFFTHFIALWDGILFDGPLKIKKSAQLRKFIGFLKSTQIDTAPSDLTLKDFEVRENYTPAIKLNRYDQTSIFQAFKHLRMFLPEIPEQKGEQDNCL